MTPFKKSFCPLGEPPHFPSHVESLPVLAHNLPLYTHCSLLGYHGHLLHVGGHWAKIRALFLDKNRMEGRDKDHWKCLSVQFSSVVQSCPTLCDPVNHSTPGLPVHHQLLEFTQTHIHQSVMPSAISSSVVHFSSCPQSLPASESFPMNQIFA